jgi:hypothetical protein
MTVTEEKKSLSDVQPGDLVVLGTGKDRRVHKVTRTTSTQIIIAPYGNEIRYWKCNGEKVGASVDRWHFPVRLPTPGELEELRLLAEWRDLIVKGFRLLELAKTAQPDAVEIGHLRSAVSSLIGMNLPQKP